MARTSRRRAVRGQFVERAGHPLGHGFPGEAIEDGFARFSAGSVAFSQRLEVSDRAGEQIWTFGRKKGREVSVKFSVHGNVRADDDGVAGERLEGKQVEPLVPRRRHADDRATVEIREIFVRDETKMSDIPRDVQL